MKIIKNEIEGVSKDKLVELYMYDPEDEILLVEFPQVGKEECKKRGYLEHNGICFEIPREYVERIAEVVEELDDGSVVTTVYAVLK